MTSLMATLLICNMNNFYISLAVHIAFQKSIIE